MKTYPGQSHPVFTPGTPEWINQMYGSLNDTQQGTMHQNQIPDKEREIVVGSTSYGNTFYVQPGDQTILGASTQYVNKEIHNVGGQNQFPSRFGVIQYGSSSANNNYVYGTGNAPGKSVKSPVYQDNIAHPDTNAQATEKARNNTEKHADVRNSSNLQLSLSFEKTYFYLLYCTMLLKYYLV